MTTPVRFRFRFSLRTLFVLVTVLGCWLGYQMNWMRQRRELVAQAFVDEYRFFRPARIGKFVMTMAPVVGGQAPGLLWLFGEKGYSSFTVLVGHAPGKFDEQDRAKVLRARDLFPESKLRYAYSNDQDMMSIYVPDYGPDVYDQLIYPGQGTSRLWPSGLEPDALRTTQAP